MSNTITPRSNDDRNVAAGQKYPVPQDPPYNEHELFGGPSLTMPAANLVLLPGGTSGWDCDTANVPDQSTANPSSICPGIPMQPENPQYLCWNCNTVNVLYQSTVNQSWTYPGIPMQPENPQYFYNTGLFLQEPLGGDFSMAYGLGATGMNYDKGAPVNTYPNTVDLDGYGSPELSHDAMMKRAKSNNFCLVIARDPFVPVCRLALHDDARIRRALEAGRGPETSFGWPATLSRRVRDMCRLHPTLTPVMNGTGSRTYAQLAAQTGRMARRLKGAGVSGPAHLVAVLCEPSGHGVVAMLSVLEAGGVYVPLDINLPASRHADMLRLCKPTLVLFHAQKEQRVKELLDAVEGGQGEGERLPAVQVDSDSGLDDDDDKKDNDDLSAQPAQPVILLFTSGSTGTPNGTLLTQASFTNHIALKTQAFDLQHDDIRRDPVALVSLMRRETVSMTIATPTEYLAWNTRPPTC
ncbi:hypothetical protein EsH8_XIV_000040 [Colletotrichum jinshuiense]